jgi:hypothetical protein
MTAALGTIALELPPAQPGLGSASPGGTGSMPPEAGALALGCGVTGLDAEGTTDAEAVGAADVLAAAVAGVVGAIEGAGDVGAALVDELAGGLTTALEAAEPEVGALEGSVTALVAPTAGIDAAVAGPSFLASPQLTTVKANPRSCVV